MSRIWQDFRGGTDGQPVTAETMDPGGIQASFIVIDGEAATGPDIAYSLAVGQRFGYPMGVQVRWAGEPTYMRWDVTDPDIAARNVMRFPVLFDTLPTVFTPYAQIRNTSGGLMGQVGVDTSGRIYIDQMSPAERFQASPGVTYWVQLAVTAGSTIADGVIEVRVEDLSGNVLFEFSNTAADTGTQPIQHYRVGGPGTDPNVNADFLIPVVGLVMGDLSEGWWPHLAPNNINIRPIDGRQIGPGETQTFVAELWNQETADSWTWSQTSGPDLSLISSNTTATVQGPDRWNAVSSVPELSDIGLSPATVQVTAMLNGQVAPPVDVRVDVLPQITWTRLPGEAWAGGTVAPWCEEGE